MGYKLTDLTEQTVFASGDWIPVVDVSDTTQSTGGSTKKASLASIFNLNYSVTDYGAVGDGSTDDTTAIQAAITAVNAAGGGTVYFPKGVYKVSSSITLYSNVYLQGTPNESIIDVSALDADIDIFAVAGSVGDAVALGSSAVENTTDLAFATSGLVADDYLLVYADKAVTTTPSYQGEIVRIDTVTDGSNVVLHDTLRDGYLTTDTASVRKITFVENITLDGLSFLGGTYTTRITRGLNASYARNISVKNCYFEKIHHSAIRMQTSINGSVTECRFKDFEYTGISYGVSLYDGCQDWNVHSNEAINLRHLVALGASVNGYGINRRINGCFNVASQMRDAGMDSHAASQDINFSNNIVKDSANDGIIVQGASAVICNNTIINCQRHGILMQPQSSYAGGYVVCGNNIINAGNIGIDINQATADYGNITNAIINDNRITNSGALAAYGAILVKSTNASPLTNITINGNSIYKTASHCITLQNCTQATVNGNSIYSQTDSIDAIRLVSDVDYSSITGNTIYFAINTATDGITNLGGNYNTFTGNVVNYAARGLYQDNKATYCTIMSNNLKGCTAPLTVGSGTGHIYQTAASDAYNVV